MPIPSPQKGESEQDFMGRCISFVKGEDTKRPNDQIVAICGTKWRGKEKQEKMLFEYYVPIQERAEVEGDFIIQGVAINETTTSNGHKFIAEELKKSAGSLVGVPLLKDHENSVDSIVGRVKAAHFNEDLSNIPFKAVVREKKYQDMIKDGRIDAVSVGAQVDPSDIEEAEDGTIIPHNIIFKELSLVAVPADSQATFNVALKNAWRGLKDAEDSNKLKGRINTQENMAQDEKQEEVKEETPETVEEPAEAPEEAKTVEAEAPAEDVSEKILKTLESLDKRLAKLEQADQDEAPAKEEVKAEPEAEAEEESEDDSEDVEEAFKIVQGHKSFSVVRNKY